MARAGSGTATTSPAGVTVTGSSTVALYLRNNDSTNNLLVNVPAIHNTDYDSIPPGVERQYSFPAGVVPTFNVQSSASTVSYNWGVTIGSN